MERDPRRSDADAPSSASSSGRSSEPSSPERELQGDERMYTGEPVETDAGVRRPRQMNVGIDNMEGGGEWPDPDTPAAPGTVGWDALPTTPPASAPGDSRSRVTANHDEIRSWVEHHGGRPVRARPSGAQDDPGVPQIDFLHGRGDRSLEPLEWDEWFRMFDTYELALLLRDGEDEGSNDAAVEFVRR